MKHALLLSLALFACSKKADAPPAPASDKPAAEAPKMVEKPAAAAYSADSAKKAIGELATCSSQYACKPFDMLAGFGAAAGADLMTVASDTSKPIEQRQLAVILIGKAKVPDAGPKLVELGMALDDNDVKASLASSDFFEAAGLCGGDATFAALAAPYDKENHGLHDHHLVPLRKGLKGFPAKAMAWAKDAMPKAKDSTKYADVITDIATPADKDTIAAMVGTTKDKMTNNRLASKAIELGATDPKLWDVFVVALKAGDQYDHHDAGHFLEDIADKIPAERKKELVDLIKADLAKDPNDPMLQGGLKNTLAKLGG